MLFGSVAKGRARPDSDVDLLVVVRDLANGPRRRRELVTAAEQRATKVHEVGGALLESRTRFPAKLDLDELARISRELRKDRELAFHEAEDLIPTEAYGRDDSVMALAWAETVVAAATTVIRGTVS